MTFSQWLRTSNSAAVWRLAFDAFDKMPIEGQRETFEPLREAAEQAYRDVYPQLHNQAAAPPCKGMMR